jgi:hypothetical protein
MIVDPRFRVIASISLLGGESPAVVARNLGISLATLEKHYAAALQKGRTIAMENPYGAQKRHGKRHGPFLMA